MRIIAGQAGGIKLKSRKNTGTRPTQDRVKEALFNMLGAAVLDRVGIDLFAGFGGLGLEALSRGAREITFVEHNKMNCRIIEQNIELCRCQKSARVFKEDVFKFLHNTERKYGMIFMDPPYGEGFVNRVLNLILDKGIITPEGLIVAEHYKNDRIDKFDSLTLLRDRKYGDTVIKIFAVEEDKNVEPCGLSGQF